MDYLKLSRVADSVKVSDARDTASSFEEVRNKFKEYFYGPNSNPSDNCHLDIFLNGKRIHIWSKWAPETLDGKSNDGWWVVIIPGHNQILSTVDGTRDVVTNEVISEHMWTLDEILDWIESNLSSAINTHFSNSEVKDHRKSLRAKAFLHKKRIQDVKLYSEYAEQKDIKGFVKSAIEIVNSGKNVQFGNLDELRTLIPVESGVLVIDVPLSGIIDIQKYPKSEIKKFICSWLDDNWLEFAESELSNEDILDSVNRDGNNFEDWSDLQKQFAIEVSEFDWVPETDLEDCDEDECIGSKIYLELK